MRRHSTANIGADPADQGTACARVLCLRQLRSQVVPKTGGALVQLLGIGQELLRVGVVNGPEHHCRGGERGAAAAQQIAPCKLNYSFDVCVLGC